MHFDEWKDHGGNKSYGLNVPHDLGYSNSYMVDGFINFGESKGRFINEGPLLQIIMSTRNGIAHQALPDSFTLRRRNQFPKEQKFFTNTEQAIHVIGLCKWLFHCLML